MQPFFCVLGDSVVRPGRAMVAESWVLLDNLRPFALFLVNCVGYDLLPEEMAAIEFGVRESDAEVGRWYEYEFAGPSPLGLRLGRDIGSGVLHFRVECAAQVAERVQIAASIMAEYRLS